MVGKIRYGIYISALSFVFVVLCMPVEATVIYYRVSEKKDTSTPLQKTQLKAPPIKKTVTPAKSAPSIKKPVTPATKKKAAVPATKKTTSSVVVKKNEPAKQVSATVVDFKVDVKNGEKKNVSEVVKQEVIDQVAQQQEAEKKAAREALIQLTKKRAELEKEAADALLSKLATNPGDASYREKMKQDQKIGELYSQFSKLQSQVDSLENDIRTLSKENTPLDTSSTTGRLMSLQKTKFLLLRQQEDLLQQIELKESYITQFVELAKRDYEFTKRLYDSYMEKYTQTQSFLKSL